MSRKGSAQHFAALLDQAVSSFSNVVFTLLTAHVLTATEFGRASILIGACIVVIGLQRAFVTDPYMISKVTDSGYVTSAFATISGAALLVSFISAPALALGGMYSTKEVLGMSIALACGLPALCAADALRMVYFRDGAARKALTLDTIWAIVQLALGTVIILTDNATGVWVVVSWLGGALAATLYVLAREQVLPSMSAGLRWVLAQRKLGKPLAVDFLSGQGAAQLSLLVVAAAAGAAQVADIKLVQVALGPFLVVIQGLHNSSMPALRDRPVEQQWQFVQGIGAVFALIGTGLTLTVLLCPVAVAKAILSDVWSHETSIILLVGAQYTVVAFTVPHSWLLQLRRDVSGPALARVLNGTTTVVLAALFSSAWGKTGAATALLVTAAFMSLYLYNRAKDD